jgi:hypothetical protein
MGTNMNKKGFALDQLEQPGQDKNVLYWHDCIAGYALSRVIHHMITDNTKIYLETLTVILNG